jgi:GTP pyrophosphokinase
MLERELARVEHRTAHKEHGASLDRIAKALGYDTAPDLFAAVGRGDKRAPAVVAMALDLATPAAQASPLETTTPPQRETATPGLTLDGIADVLAKRGACCKPVPGDDVLGFVTRGRGVVIHRRDCSQVRATHEPERVVEVRWHSDKKSAVPVEIEVKTGDAADTLSNLTAKIASFGTPVVGVRRMQQAEGVAAWRLSVECVDSHQLAHLLSRLARDPGVLDVRRIRG